MDALDVFLRAEIEPLQYFAFFGALVLFGVLEVAVGRGSGAARRLRRWPLNYGITALNIVALGALPVSGVVAADFARENGLGALNAVAISPLLALVIGFLLRSLISWATHLAMHKIPLLWRVHRVHHTDTYVDVSTTVRFHPVEFLINTPILVASVVALGISPVTLMLYELFDAAMAVFTHANVRLPRQLDRILRLVLVTPDMHRLHHSSWQPETDSNYGATLSIWDHLFATHRSAPVERLGTMQLGLAECQDDRPLSFWWLLTLPVRNVRASQQQPPGCGVPMTDSNPAR